MDAKKGFLLSITSVASGSMRKTASIIFSVAVALAMCPALSFAQMLPGKIEVTKVVGNVELTIEDGASEKLAPGAVLQAGVKIETDAKERAHLWFANGTHLVVLENTELEIRRFSIVTNKKTPQSEFYKMSVWEEPSNSATTLRLPFGSLRIEVAKLNVPISEFRVRTPFVDVDVRGTDFKVEQEAEFARVSTYKGSVLVTPDLSLDKDWGRTVEVTEGKSVVYRLRRRPVIEGFTREAGKAGAGGKELDDDPGSPSPYPPTDGPSPLMPEAPANVEVEGPLDPTLIDEDVVTSKTNGEGKQPR
ncbi:MAG: FecR family protein [Puniceicoccales bacterium]|jgi:hypothetical protein|nr:FecR family protein [Puniceicoccales bacterium]